MRRSSERPENWKQLYLAALFENNKAAMAAKISEAQRAIAMRRRRIMDGPSSSIEERQALDTALFSLQALRECLGSGVSAVA